MGRGDIYNGLNYVKNKQRYERGCFWDKGRDFDVKRERERNEERERDRERERGRGKGKAGPKSQIKHPTKP